MEKNKEAISSKYLTYGIDEDINIYRGKFCVYLDKKYKCFGNIIYKMSPPISINVEAKILFTEDIDDIIDIDYDDAILELHGYKPVSMTINSKTSNFIEGYINENTIKSKNNYVDYVDFDIINLDKIPGKLINHKEKLYAGRIEFEVNEFKVIIDKRYDYTKDLKEELKYKSGMIITHTGRIIKKDNTYFKTTNINELLEKIESALSFMCGRYIEICCATGYIEDKNVYRLWRNGIVTTFKFVPTWSDTISNYHNFEKYMSLMVNKLDDEYYGLAIKHVIDWYIDSLNNMSLENNIISIQIALETLSYLVLVEQYKILTDEEFDKNTTSKNIKLLLDECEIRYGKNELDFFDRFIINKFNDGVDLVIYFRNSIVHPSRKRHSLKLDIEDMWNIIQIGTRYVELIILSIIGYKGEYSNRLNDRWFGEVEVVPWSE